MLMDEPGIPGAGNCPLGLWRAELSEESLHKNDWRVVTPCRGEQNVRALLIPMACCCAELKPAKFVEGLAGPVAGTAGRKHVK